MGRRRRAADGRLGLSVRKLTYFRTVLEGGGWVFLGVGGFEVYLEILAQITTCVVVGGCICII